MLIPFVVIFDFIVFIHDCRANIKSISQVKEHTDQRNFLLGKRIFRLLDTLNS